MVDDIQLTSAAVQPWLETLFPGAPQAQVTPLVADISARRYFRARWGPPSASSLVSCIIMVMESWQGDEPPDFLSVGEHLRSCGVRVPEVYGVEPGAGWMALEDFGDQALAGLWQQVSAAEQVAWGQKAMRALVRMHTAGTEFRGLSCPAFELAFDVPKLLSELQFFRHHAIEGLWQHELGDAEREAFDQACEPLCEQLAAQPSYFCHRDYHGWNLMAHGTTVGVLDFQDARMGPQPYDVVSLLVDRGTPSVLGEAVSQALVDDYIAQFQAETGTSVDRSAFDALFELVAIQRCLKAVGSFAFATVVHQRQHYQDYIPSTLAYVQPLLERYDCVKPLRTLLQDYTPIG